MQIGNTSVCASQAIFNWRKLAHDWRTTIHESLILARCVWLRQCASWVVLLDEPTQLERH